MDFDSLKKFINIVPNIDNNIALICYNSCNLKTSGLLNNKDLIIKSILPNLDSDTSNPIITINNDNNLFITFNDIEDKNYKYEFKFITFVKNIENNIYLTLIFKNKSNRIIIVKIPLSKTSDVENEVDKLLFPILNKQESISENTINLNLSKFIPNNNSFYFTTIQSDILLILFKYSIKINNENFDKLLDNIHSDVTTNNILTSPLFFNEGNEKSDNKICKSSEVLINSLINNEENKDSKASEENKDSKASEEYKDSKASEENKNNIINIIFLIINIFITIIFLLVNILYFKKKKHWYLYLIIIILIFITFYMYKNFYYIISLIYILFIIILTYVFYRQNSQQYLQPSVEMMGGSLERLVYIKKKNSNSNSNNNHNNHNIKLITENTNDNKLINYIRKLYNSIKK